VIVGRSEDGSQLKVESHGPTVESTRKRGYINGLKEADRARFNEIIDTVRKEEDPGKRVEQMNEQIDELKKDPNNFALVRYLESEVSHTMLTSGIRPRVFSIQEAYHR
jgi:Na+/phosphate symporter